MASEAAGEASSEWLPSEAYDPTNDPTFQADSHQPAPPIYVGLYSGVLVNVVLAAICFLAGLLSMLTSSPQLAGRPAARAEPSTPTREVRAPSRDLTPATPDTSEKRDSMLSEDFEGDGSPDGPGQPDERMLRGTAAAFERCLLGEDDVDVGEFMEACALHAETIGTLGRFTKLAVREVHANVRKIRKPFSRDPQRFKSMRALLQEEKNIRGHTAATGLVDDSAAMGLLWSRRGLSYWIEMLTQIVENNGALAKEVFQPSKKKHHRRTSSSGTKSALKAYEESLEAFNGYAGKRIFKMAAKLIPSWREMAPKLAPSAEMLIEDVTIWLKPVEQTVQRMVALHEETDLEDWRKSM